MSGIDTDITGRGSLCAYVCVFLLLP